MTTKKMRQTTPKMSRMRELSRAAASGSRIRALISPPNLTTTGTEARRGGIPESSATTTMWASELFRYL